MASNRPVRSSAGNRMARLIDEETEDDFYKTAFGGFDETEEDVQYQTEDSEEDVFDSDFGVSVDSDEDEDSGDEVEAPKKRRKKIIPVASKKDVKATKSNQKRERKSTLSSSKADNEEGSSKTLRKSRRSATIQQSQEFQRRMKDRAEKESKQIGKKYPDSRPLTQKELLEEAKITEKHNLASLHAYQQLEKEKKKTKVVKHKHNCPVIRYQSLTMPVVEVLEETSSTSNNASVDDSIKKESDDVVDRVEVVGTTEQYELKDDDHSQTIQSDVVSHVDTKYCRNFITFTDSSQFPDAYFLTTTTKKAARLFCPVTGLKARYVDPATLIPYATLEAFKRIREAAEACGQQMETTATLQ